VSARATLLTVCGGGEDYELLLGCLERHLAHGSLVVVDTSPEDVRRRFDLPAEVSWFHCPLFGRGAEGFRFATALNVGIGLAEELAPDVLVQVDADEYFEADLSAAIARASAGTVLDVKTLHHTAEGEALDFSDEWHRRIWPARRGIRFRLNPRHQNPEFHPAMDVPMGIPIERETGTLHHHLHYAVGSKASDLHTARTTIPGWPDAGRRVRVPPWPALVARWQRGGPPPSSSFRQVFP
jgi:hypothetical protein